MHTAWEIRIRPGLTPAAAHLAHEQSLLALCASGVEQPIALIWESEPALVVSQSDRHLPRFAAAVTDAERAGWPVIVRHTGGTAVPLVPGIINLGLIASWRTGRPTLGAAYEPLCSLLIGAMGNLGITATTGRAPGAFCDGRWNILVNQRKVAGTSQRQSCFGGRGAVLLHATVIVDADPAMLTAITARFYETAGQRVSLSADAVSALASVRRELSGDALKRAFVTALANELATWGTVPAWCDTPSSPSSPAATSAVP